MKAFINNCINKILETKGSKELCIAKGIYLCLALLIFTVSIEYDNPWRRKISNLDLAYPIFYICLCIYCIYLFLNLGNDPGFLDLHPISSGNLRNTWETDQYGALRDLHLIGRTQSRDTRENNNEREEMSLKEEEKKEENINTNIEEELEKMLEDEETGGNTKSHVNDSLAYQLCKICNLLQVNYN